jgi:hypothetical protein
MFAFPDEAASLKLFVVEDLVNGVDGAARDTGGT